VPHGARLPQREKEKKTRNTASYSYNYRYSLYGTIWNIVKITIIFAAGEKKMTHNGIPEGKKKAHEETRSKTRNTPTVFCFFLIVEVFIRRV
jgi:hypothetical protein